MTDREEVILESFQACKLPPGACEFCGGEGQVMEQRGRDDDYDAVDCTGCDGSGLARSPIREQVIEFHAAFDHPGKGEGPPHIPTDVEVRLRMRLVIEEAIEFIEACVDEDVVVTAGMIKAVKMFIGHLVADAPLKLDLVEYADALADLDYVSEGSRLTAGIDGRPVAAEVHRSNMSKVGGGKSPDGKSLKPPGWTSPDIAGVLKKQGWVADE